MFKYAGGETLLINPLSVQLLSLNSRFWVIVLLIFSMLLSHGHLDGICCLKQRSFKRCNVDVWMSRIGGKSQIYFNTISS